MLCAITVLEVKHGGLADTNYVGKNGHDASNQGTQYPTLRAVKQYVYTAPEIFAASEHLDSVGICNAVMDPVG